MKFFNLIKFNIFFISFLLFAQLSHGADRVYLDISAPEARKISFAVPWLLNKDLNGQKQKLGGDLADILAKALKFHGIILIIPSSEYGGTQNTNWKNLGADFVVQGSYALTSKGITLELRLFDVAGNETMMGKSFSGTIKQKETMLFKFCDDVIEELTGTRGIASSQIAFVSHNKSAKEVYLTDILGRKLRQVTRHRNLIVSPRFTPDGKALSYTSYHTGNANLYITKLNQSKVTRALSRRKGMNLAPAWSPDGTKMILTLSVNGNPDLFMLDDKGRIIEQLTKRAGINVSPTWSPDGSRIVFVSDRSGKPQLYVMDLRTRNTQRITFKGSENAEPSWSPKEDLIVYSSLRDGVYQLFTTKPEPGAPAEQLTSDLSHHESPMWSPDGNQIIFSKRDGKKHQIYAIMKNGSFQRRVLAFPGSHTYPQWSR
ncbi:Tol-Pal system beta propeller repeat protein TolB [Desulfopila sp. IMCC35008]|uniref:Tol-Pal system beta propeller repeat protein TolB n=1 Tax=Desulfopila sp. IMCC35008 TaxID=2653858 RepID=UPI0013D25F49|nr:Tol-Pal system beta propeller repeat protein TolB [Desulfopila sp. IMCC35008]